MLYSLQTFCPSPDHCAFGLLSNIYMVTSFQDFDRHPYFYPTLHVLRLVSSGKQGRGLHAQATHVFRALVHVPESPQGFVRLNWMPVASILVDIGQFAAKSASAWRESDRAWKWWCPTGRFDKRREKSKRHICFQVRD